MTVLQTRVSTNANSAPGKAPAGEVFSRVQPAGGPDRPPRTAVVRWCSKSWHAARVRSGAVWKVVLRFPVRCVLLPLVCGAIIIALGLVAVSQARQDDINSRRGDAAQACAYIQDFAQRRRLEIVQIGWVLAGMVALNPEATYWTQDRFAAGSKVAVNTFISMGPQFVTQVALQPHGGAMQRFYRPTSRLPAFPPHPCMANSAFENCNLTAEEFRDNAIGQAVNMSAGPAGIHPTGMAVWLGGRYLANTTAPGSAVYMYRFPVFVANSTENETWGWPRISEGCPDPGCFQVTDSSTGRGNQFWGFVSYTWILDPALNVANTSVPYAAASRGYNLVVEQGYMNDTSNAYIVVRVPADQELTQDAYVCVVDYSTFFPNSDGVAPMYTAYNLISPSGWVPTWTAGAIAAVVVTGVAVAALLCAVAVSWGEHQLLLFALVPEQLVSKLRADVEYINDTGKAIPVAGAATPADHMLSVIRDVLHGKLPEIRDAVLVRAALLHSASVYEPIDLQAQLKELDLDDEASRALQRELQGLDRDMYMARQTTNIHEAEEDAGGLDTLEQAVTFLSAVPIAPPGAGTACKRCSALRSNDGLSIVPARKAGTFGSISSPGFLARKSENGGGGVVVGPAPPAPALITDLEKFLGTWWDSFEFNAFELQQLSDGHGLSVMCFYLLHQTDLFDKLAISRVKAARLFRHMEAAYLDNPYHNSTHAADVLQTFHVLIRHGGLLDMIDDDVTHLACILAAAAHDLSHPGTTNDFLIATGDKLAIDYNDHSPAENFHCATLFKLLQQPDLDILSRFHRKERHRLRKLVIELVLATDMKQHVAITARFAAVFNVRSSDPTAADQSSLEVLASAAMVPKDEVEQSLALQVALKCADVGNTAKTLEVSVEWAKALEAEFFAQGDREKAEKLPVSPLFDREKPGASKCQVGFFEFVCLPMFSSFCAVFPGATPFLTLAVANYRFHKGPPAAAEMVIAIGPDGDAPGRHTPPGGHKGSEDASTRPLTGQRSSRNSGGRLVKL